ncbi:hypothetical protein POM88_019898 [Heracleum sosnowskyi]|uniref:Helitron helicase-like domain-containing protein n=1 Tax=Heracleum sosnowskyi TaxID=360622 RepID=A0AAD8IBJ2_9APIA|nr:hypothetical protein POM88_019898 [Heracleum sosnowskyi]
MDLPGQRKSNNEQRIQRNKRRREAYNKQTKEERIQRNKLRRDQRNKQNSGIVQHEVEADGTDEISRHFQKKRRMYNNVFAFTSTGGKIDNRFNQGGGPFVYRVLGEMYHQMGSLLPDNDNSKAVYSQIYMFDNEQELERRLHFPRDNETLDVRIIEPLSSMLDRDNEMLLIRIEFQKKGLPHAHIVVWLAESHRCHSTGDIDFLISAEIPDKDIDPLGFEATTIDQNGYPIYKHRDDGRTITCKGVEIDNMFVVPYNRGSGDPKFTISKEHLHSLTLYDVDVQLRKTGKSLLDFPMLPPLNHSLHQKTQNALLYEEYMYDRHALRGQSQTLISMLNEKQKTIFEVVVENVMENKEGLFFVYDHGVFKLYQNMRLGNNVPPVNVGGTSIPYSEWVIKVGDGNVESITMDDS